MKHYDNEFFNRMIDGEVAPQEKQEFLEHISGCVECAKEYRYMQKAETAFRHIRVFEAPVSINAMVLKKIVKTVRPGEGSKKFFIGMLTGLTAILLLVFGFAMKAGADSTGSGQADKFSLKIDPSFISGLAKPFTGLNTIVTPEFGAVLLLLVLSIATFFFVERLKKN